MAVPVDQQVAAVAADPTAKQFAAVAGTAFVASFLRYQRWQGADGKIMWWKPVIELPGAFAIAVMSYGLSFYLWHNLVSFWIVAGIAGTLSMVGAPALTVFVGKWIGADNGPPKGN